ncbi:hypothetical protein [Vibrio sp. AND4]|uniref:hypothetical protein n=1 Tax=Vibrio sp. AND4 TaxID=314289 RepID=UPI00015EFA40|nr:hypothetical protein [Vibrio sp. AND4]EDP60033.1 bacteriophage f237 ORF5 [Vibrio sp. AND4]
MIHYLRFITLFIILLISNDAYSLEARVADISWQGCAYKGQWVDPYKMNECFIEQGYYTHCSFRKSRGAKPMYPYRTSCHYGSSGTSVLSYSEIRCPTNSLFDPKTLQCSYECDYGYNGDGTCMNVCQFKKSINEKRMLEWSEYIYSDQVTGACYGDYGATRCELSRLSVHMVICTDNASGELTQNSLCNAQFEYTGKQCGGGTDFWGAQGPDVPIIPPPTDKPIDKPDTPIGDIEDPSVLPDDSSNTPMPNEVDPEAEVEKPEMDDSTDSAVVSAVTNLNKDINSALHDLNVDINESQASIAAEIINVKGSIVDNTQAVQEQQINDNKIYNNTKTLIQQAADDITKAINNSNGNGENQGIAEELEGFGDSLDGIERLLSRSGFISPGGDDVNHLIFASSDFIRVNEGIADKKRTIEGYVNDIKGLVSIGTNFSNGSLTDRSFTIKGSKVESGLQRFDDVTPYVRPVILFICSLIALFILFGHRSK